MSGCAQPCPALCNPWIVASQALLSTGFSRQECWILLQGIFLTQGSNWYLLCLLHWQADSFTTEPPGKPIISLSHFIHPLVSGHWDCFHPVAIVNNAAINIHGQVFVLPLVFSSFGYIPRSGVAHMVILFNLLRNLQTVFGSSCTILHFYQ